MKNIFLICMLLLGFDTVAEEAKVPSMGLEVHANQMIVSKDGTGVMTNISCHGCTSKTLKITAATKAYVQGAPADTLSAKAANLGRVAYVRFNTQTHEVLTIRW